MNRSERPHAIVEELRAVSPPPRSAAWLARQFEISTRTVERDLTALRESGVAIRGVGRTGGYFLDRHRGAGHQRALRATGDSPFAADTRIAAQKALAVLPVDVRGREESLSSNSVQNSTASEPLRWSGECNAKRRHHGVANAITDLATTL